MKYQVYFGIAIRIVILFGTGFLWTFINPALSTLFGDKPCANPKGCGANIGDKTIDWSAAHYWYYWCMFFLFLLSLINVVVGIVKTINKHYPEL